MEVLARDQAWERFLAEARFSLEVWRLDASLSGEMESAVAWLRRCHAQLGELLAPKTRQLQLEVGGMSLPGSATAAGLATAAAPESYRAITTLTTRFPHERSRK
jgi:hypothetical protein